MTMALVAVVVAVRTLCAATWQPPSPPTTRSSFRQALREGAARRQQRARHAARIQRAAYSAASPSRGALFGAPPAAASRGALQDAAAAARSVASAVASGVATPLTPPSRKRAPEETRKRDHSGEVTVKTSGLLGECQLALRRWHHRAHRKLRSDSDDITLSKAASWSRAVPVRHRRVIAELSFRQKAEVSHSEPASMHALQQQLQRPKKHNPAAAAQQRQQQSKRSVKCNLQQCLEKRTAGPQHRMDRVAFILSLCCFARCLISSSDA
eukprot:jgi/Mesen1/9933/ME000070S09220